MARIEAALETRPLRTVPCNNDLLAGNYVDDGRQLWLIDFEYAGNNDPCFELGNTCQELQFDESRLIEVCSAYFGAAEPDMLARMKLNMIMSDVGWTLWAAIQAKISTIDFDYWGWAIERWGRAGPKWRRASSKPGWPPSRPDQRAHPSRVSDDWSGRVSWGSLSNESEAVGGRTLHATRNSPL